MIDRIFPLPTNKRVLSEVSIRKRERTTNEI